MSDYLPEDIVVRIFERLPTKSLVRFSCLSKRWNLLILSDPVFAKSHFQLASQQQTLTRRFLFNADSSLPGLECIDSEEAGGNTESYWVRKKAHTPFINGCDYIIGCCSCNGLVCVLFKCSVSKQTRLYIWNPSTGRNKEFPCPNEVLEEVNGICTTIHSYGFGYVSSRDEYKVIVCIRIDDMRKEFNILSLGAANAWKQIEAPHTWKRIGRKGTRNGTLFRETLHWPSEDDIIAFDLNKEEFRTMPLPPIGNDLYTAKPLGVSMGGCLCLVYSTHPYHSAQFWVMREYDVADSWSMLFTLSYVIPLGLLLATETSIFLETGHELRLIRISGDDENKVCIVRKEVRLNTIVYQETLLWLP